MPDSLIEPKKVLSDLLKYQVYCIRLHCVNTTSLPDQWLQLETLHWKPWYFAVDIWRWQTIFPNEILWFFKLSTTLNSAKILRDLACISIAHCL